MAKQDEKPRNDFITLTDAPCQLGKFSNNLVQQASEEDEDETEDVGIFTFPVTGIVLTEALLNALYGDDFTHRSWFDTKRDGRKEPLPWITKLPDGEFPFSQKFDKAVVRIAYTQTPNEKSTRDEFEECKIGRIFLKPKSGGDVELRCHVQIRPGLGRENLRLQEHQKCGISLSVLSAELAIKSKSTQQDLFDGKNGADKGAGFAAAAKAQADKVASGEADGAGASSTEDLQKFESDARAQVEAYNRGTPAGAH